jgi:hypothetical protein
MRHFLAAAIVTAIMTTPGQAQFHEVGDKSQGGRIGPPPSGLKDSDKVDEKSYNAAVNRIPESAQKHDPWQMVREKPPSK